MERDRELPRTSYKASETLPWQGQEEGSETLPWQGQEEGSETLAWQGQEEGSETRLDIELLFCAHIGKGANLRDEPDC